MNRIAVVSLFRNAASYIQNYFDQMLVFQELLNENGYNLSLVLGYGDSTDGTGELLFEECQNLFDATLLDVSHGGQHFGSVVHPQRFKQLAYSGNQLLSAIPANTHAFGIVESDLHWEPETLLKLIKGLELYQNSMRFGPRRFIMAPLVLQKEIFYDTWAFRKDKVHFQHQPPYHSQLHPKGRYTEMDSVGSCLFLTGNLSGLVCLPEKDVVVGLCRMAKEAGARVYLDRECKVYHP